MDKSWQDNEMEDGLSSDFTVRDHEEQSPISKKGRVVSEANAIESGEKNLAGVMSTGLYAKSVQYDMDIVAEETGKDVLGQEKCNGQHVPAKTDLKMKLNVELTDAGMESGCSITEKNKLPVADILDLVQQGDLQEGELEKPSLSPECRHECDLPEETVLRSRNTGSLQSTEQSPCGLESVGYGALASAAAHTENGFGESKDCHVKSAPEKTYVSDPFSHHDTEEGILKNDDCMDTSQQDNEMEGLPEEIVLPSKTIGSLPHAEQSPFSLESLFSQKSIDESVGYGAHASATTHTENGFGESRDCHVKSAPEKTHVSEPFSHHDTEEGSSKNDCMDTSWQDNEMEDAIENPSITLSTPGHAIGCQELKRPNGVTLSSFQFAAESEISQYVSVSGSGPCQQRVNETSSMQATYNIEMLNQHHEEHNQNNEDQITHIIPASSVPEAVEIEQSETEIGLIPAAEASVLPVPDEQLNNKLEGNEVDEHTCSYDRFLNREDLHKDDCMDLCNDEDNHPNDLPAPRSPQQFSFFHNDNDSGSVVIGQSSRRRGINDKLRAKRQSFKVSTVEERYIAKSATCLKPGDSPSQSALALRRNRGNTTAVKVGHPVKPDVDRSAAKDSSRRVVQPPSTRKRDSLRQSGTVLRRNGKDTTAVKSKTNNKPWL